MKSYTQFIVYTDNIRHNFNQIRKHTDSKICAMVKADGYGYGMITVAKALEGVADFFGVANGAEALELRKHGINNPILVCGIVKENLIPEIILQEISFACNSFEMMKKIEKIAKIIKKKAKIHIKLNTGMNRLGVKDILELRDMTDFISASDYIRLQGIFTHNGFSECQNKELLASQHKRFFEIIDSNKIYQNIIVHFANSGAFVSGKEYHHDMVRTGKILYGVNPANSDFELDLKPIFALRSEIIQIQKVSHGEYIGYGENVVAKNDTTIGVLPIGYADGLISQYVGSEVIINSNRYKIISICMDLAIVEIDERVMNGDKVLVMGYYEGNNIPVTEYSEKSHKVASQVVANLNKNRFDIVVE